METFRVKCRVSFILFRWCPALFSLCKKVDYWLGLKYQLFVLQCGCGCWHSLYCACEATHCCLDERTQNAMLLVPQIEGGIGSWEELGNVLYNLIDKQGLGALSTTKGDQNSSVSKISSFWDQDKKGVLMIDFSRSLQCWLGNFWSLQPSVVCPLSSHCIRASATAESVIHYP